METKTLLIRIGGLDYTPDMQALTFRPTAPGATVKGAIPFSQLRSKAEHWFILWDKKTQAHYSGAGNWQPIPLSVAWTQVVFAATENALKERLELIIRLCEAIELLRSGDTAQQLHKADMGLNRALTQYLNSRA